MLKYRIMKPSSLIFPMVILLFFSLSPVFAEGLNEKEYSDIFHYYGRPEEKFRIVYDLNSSIEKRIKEIPSDILEKYREEDRQLLNDKINYNSYKIQPAEMLNLSSFLKLLPESYMEILKKKLIGIYFVEGFLGGGLTDWLMKDDENEMYYIILLNSDILKKSFSEWENEKYSSAFMKSAGDDGYRLKIQTDDSIKAFCHILIHETAHIIDSENTETPYSHIFHTQYRRGLGKTVPSSTEFTSPVWISFSSPKEEYEYAFRNEINFYAMNQKCPILQNNLMLPVFESLKKTGFVSLYGAKTWTEDFAEISAFYFMKNILKIDYKINIYNRNSIVYEYEPMKSERVRTRFSHMEKYYSGKNSSVFRRMKTDSWK